ncbi:LysM peptidoglycan-binding domain-containing protein [Salmonella enterica subsp. enterica serovar Teshie]|uniref:LysM peptidoglycan-binding domain-containing protein n=1 Tax=Salmonella enterica TaxID=28901 RepID=A0A763SWI6_SALER|nr:LysM peptidoglycan-binding domain-containing protein [Salmonella enterica]EBR9811897.1 hypothetical protein [Salmonella enterica subsp. enterica serovar Teshie]EBU9729366.1 hypothetical protein [Salmonella enterica subsp. enterica serovar Teshie]EBV3614634.1 hypothetical protein [Salmonella enterica subsp. enterica serovar Teshie]ECB5045958.1 LysM peptidoglycan-binding domain-containing protein [Salmonella enterica subsp. enterica serovar Teshie]ECD2693732.1 LysM peptidoglycan-binding domai
MMNDKDNSEKDSKTVDWDKVKDNIKDYTGDYVKVTLNIGGSINGDKLYATGRLIDESIQSAMASDKYLLTYSKYMVYSSGFVVKNGISTYELYVAYKSHDANTFLKSALSTIVTIAATALTAETGPVLAPAIGGVAGIATSNLWDNFISTSKTGQLAINLTDHYLFGKDNSVDISAFNNWLPFSSDNWSLFAADSSLINLVGKSYDITQIYRYFCNHYASVDQDYLSDTINKVLTEFYNKTTDYTIVSGDTLSEIAKKLNTSVSELLLLNPSIADPDKIKTGDILHIPLSHGVSMSNFNNPDFFKFVNDFLFPGASGPDTSEAIRVSDPLVIDLNGDGVKTISKSAGIVFDHDGNLFAENTGWISSEDGLLVLDKNQDGKIDSGKELFGGNTELEDGTLAKNGYEALQRYDENKDGVIDKNDSIWGKLKIWQDKNTDATVGDGELFSLTKFNIAGIKLDYGDVNATDSEGNKHLHKSEVIYEDGHTGIAEDLGLETDKGKTRYTGDKEVSDDAKVLPYIRGFGNMADLQVAMSHNSDLKALVSQYSVADEAGKFRLTEQIIYAWAGVTGIDIHSRGKNVNAQHLAVLEVTTGEEYRTSYHQKNPNVNDGILLEKEYCKFYGYVSAMLQVQTTYKEFFSKINLTLNKDMSNFTLNFSEVEKYIAGISSQSEALNLRGLLFSLLSYMPQFEDIRNSVGIPAVRDSTGDTAYQGGNNHPDYYFFEKGHGRDVVTDYAGTAAEADTLVFSQAQSGQATFEHTGDDLVIHAYGDDNSVTLKDYFRGENYQRFNLQFDDAEVTYPALHNDTESLPSGQSILQSEMAAVDARVNSLIEAMAVFAPECAAQSTGYSESLNQYAIPTMALPNQ